LDRGHQDKLTAFKQELRVISKTLQQQKAILLYAERIATAARPSEITAPIQPDPSPSSYLMPEEATYLEQRHSHSHERSRSIARERPSPVYYPGQSPAAYIARPGTPGSQIDPTDPSGIQGLLIQDSYALIERKMRLFEELRIRAEELEEEVCHAFILPLYQFTSSPIHSNHSLIPFNRTISESTTTKTAKIPQSMPSQSSQSFFYPSAPSPVSLG
jgi:hypothetical protein